MRAARKLSRRGGLVAFLVACACSAQAGTTLQVQDSGVDVRLRGISAVDADTAWASGQKGTVLRTVNGGAQWQAMQVDGADALDFRDVEGFSADVAVVLSIGPGEASRMYRTEDAGQSWTLTLQNKDSRGFFDCMAFEGERGWMLGDPVDGRYQLFATENAGRDWRQLANGPQADGDEAAFAASGTCIARLHGALAVASGGTRARIHLLRDGQQALEHLCHRLEIEEGGTTADGLFTVQKAECLGACADAPVILVNDRQMCSFMSNERLDELVAMLASHAVIERAA